MRIVLRHMQPETTSHKKGIALAIGVIVILLVIFGVVKYLLSRGENADLRAFTSSKQGSLRENNPAPLQDFVVTRLAHGDNDKLVRSAMYFISHRYFDNKGDIYELYDFVHAHKELEFMNKAEAIYPGPFARIAKKEIAKGYNFDSMSAFLAYLEAADMASYADVAMLGTLANKHAELALNYRTLAASSTLSSDSRALYSRLEKKSLEKALVFAQKAKVILDPVIGSEIASLETRLNAAPSSIVVGLNQYAHALQFLKALSAPFEHTHPASSVYEYSAQYALKYDLEFYPFTNYLYASSLVVTGEVSEKSVQVPLDRLVAYAKTLQNPKNGYTIISRIINARQNNEIGSFDPEKVRVLARFHKDFKEWLIAQGWPASEFK